MSDYTELKRLAEVATQCSGPRRVETDYNGVHQVVGDGSWKILNAWHTPDGKGLENAKFTAAASPTAILALIAENDAMAGMLQRFVAGEHDQDENQAERHMYFTEAQSLLALVNGELEAHTIVPDSAIKAIHAQRDQLIDEIERLKDDVEDHSSARLHYRGKVGKALAERDQLKAENERLRTGMKGDYDLDAWLDWTQEAEAMRKDADLGRVLLAFIDRISDPTDCDPIEKIAIELVMAFDAAMGKGEQS